MSGWIHVDGGNEYMVMETGSEIDKLMETTFDNLTINLRRLPSLAALYGDTIYIARSKIIAYGTIVDELMDEAMKAAGE